MLGIEAGESPAGAQDLSGRHDTRSPVLRRNPQRLDRGADQHPSSMSVHGIGADLEQRADGDGARFSTIPLFGTSRHRLSRIGEAPSGSCTKI
jgi:hypothetical protein